MMPESRKQTLLTIVGSFCVLSLLLLRVSAVIAEDVTTTAEDYFQQGRIAFQNGQLTESIQAYQRAVVLDPSYATAWFNLALAYAKTENWRNAAKCFQSVLQLNSTDAEAHNQLAVIYLAMRYPLEALKEYDRARELGYIWDPSFGKKLEIYRDRKSPISYTPYNSEQAISVVIRGNPLGNELLKRDTINTIQYLQDEALIQGVAERIDVEFLGWERDALSWFEKWVIRNGVYVKSYNIKFTMTPDGGTDMMVVEDKHVPDFEGERHAL